MKEEFNINGYIVLENVISQEIFKKLSGISPYYIQRTLKRQNNTGNAGFRLFRTENLLHDFLVPELININLLYDFLLDILQNNYILKEILLYFSLPNNNMQELHRDVNPLFYNLNNPTPTFLIAIQYPLVEFDYHSGGTRILKGSHKILEEPTKIENEDLTLIRTKTPKVSKRGCLIRDCRAWHGAGVNKTEEIRPMFTLAFAKSWFGKPLKVSRDLYFSIDKNKRHIVRC